jgi:cell division protein FtsB
LSSINVYINKEAEMAKREIKNATLKAAREYVRQQIKTMKAHGASPKISAEAFNDIVQRVAAAAK